uniref:SHSP domain-containing protein n=1 Tax=Monopterus albus TaxID=43700 RepID=A0A3Q3KD66_MONAL
MTSLTSSSRRSSSSYRTSSCYSTSSSYRSEGSLGRSADSLDPLFEPFLDSADHPGLFGEEVIMFNHPLTLSSQTSARPVIARFRCLGDSYYMSANVSQFEPHDIVVMAYNHHVVIHAQKVLDDGSISDTFTHKSLFPEDMDPLSVSGTLNPDGTLVVSVRRTATLGGLESLEVPTSCSEAHL